MWCIQSKKNEVFFFVKNSNCIPTNKVGEVGQNFMKNLLLMISHHQEGGSSWFWYVIISGLHEEDDDAVDYICIILHSEDICQRRKRLEKVEK